MSDNTLTHSERNKYVVADNIAETLARTKEYDSIEALNSEIKAQSEILNKQAETIATNNTAGQKTDAEAMQYILTNNTNTKISEELLIFLAMNHNFRNNVNEMFSQIYGATNLLKTKIESGS